MSSANVSAGVRAIVLYRSDACMMIERRQDSISCSVMVFSFAGNIPRRKLYNKKLNKFQPIFR